VTRDAAVRSRLAIKLVFLIHAMATGSMFTRIPDLQQGLGIDAATLGLTFIGQPVGAMVMFLFAGRVVERTGTIPILLFSLPLMAVGALLMALAPSPAALFVAIAGFSGLFALSNVAMNVEADRVEAATDKRLMNTCHGIWSLGQLAVFLLGVLARAWDLSPALHFGLIVPAIGVATLIVVLPMHPAIARSHGATGRRRGLALPSGATMRLLGFAIGGALVETAARTWSIIYARDSFAAPDWADALPLPVFVAAIACGRFFADGWTGRYRPSGLGRMLMLTALIGLGVVVAAPNLPVALAGFALMGFGVCTAFPASTSAAAQLGDRPSSENVAALTLSVQMVMLGAPALMGLVADAWGIRMTFALIAPMVVLSVLLARALEPRVGAVPRVSR
jgi:MFS family permease